MRFKIAGHPWYCFVAPAILIVLACRQLYLAHSHHLTPWKGGGFGMFATLDRNENRLLRCYLITDQGEIPVELPHSEKYLVDQIRSMPTRGLLSKLATKMAQASWVSESAFAERPGQILPQGPVRDSTDRPFATDSSSPLSGGLTRAEANTGSLSNKRVRTLRGRTPATVIPYVADFSKVRVEVWRIRFDSDSRRLIAQKVAELTKDRESF
jgi:hypothetical protein